MPKLRVHNFAISIDGYGAGPSQSLDNPIGVGGPRLHEWVFATRYGRRMIGEEGGEEGIDERFLVAGDTGIGATIMGRNMFGPVRGPWADEEWKGWWGDDPPFHSPVFVLTHHPRPTIEMKGGTTFHFIDAGAAEALEAAREAAGGLDVRVGGGPSTIREFLAADLIDHMHIAIVPIVLARGEGLWDGLQELEERFGVEG